MALNAYVSYEMDGITNTVSIPFNYLNKSHLLVTVDSLRQSFTWLTDNSIQFTATPTAGSIVEIRRTSPIGQELVDFTSGGMITEAELNRAYEHNFFLAQEYADLFKQIVTPALVTIAEGLQLTVDPVEVADQVVQDYLQGVLYADLQSKLLTVDDLTLTVDGHAGQLTVLQNDLLNAQADLDQALLDLTTLNEVPGNLAVLDQKVDTEVAALTSTTEAAAETLMQELLRQNNSMNAERLNYAFIINEQTARVTADDALASDLTILTTRMGDAEADIITEQTARSSGDSALAADITTLSTTVGDNSASITSLFASIDGIGAKYSLKLDVNGYISGVELISDGTTSSFQILSDQFKVVFPSALGITPFTVGLVDGQSQVGILGTLVIDGTLYGRSIVAESITADKLSVLELAAISAALGDVTANKVTLATDGYIKAGTTSYGTVYIPENPPTFLGWFMGYNTNGGGELVFQIQGGGSELLWTETNGLTVNNIREYDVDLTPGTDVLMEDATEKFTSEFGVWLYGEYAGAYNFNFVNYGAVTISVDYWYDTTGTDYQTYALTGDDYYVTSWDTQSEVGSGWKTKTISVNLNRRKEWFNLRMKTNNGTSTARMKNVKALYNKRATTNCMY